MASRRLLPAALLFSAACPATWAQDPVGREFQVNSYTPGNQAGRSMASDANGNFVVVWTSNAQDGSADGIFGQRFNPSGVPQGAEFQVNSYTTGWQASPVVASDRNGNFVVVWFGSGQPGVNWGVFGQRFSVSGVPQGSEFEVNSYTTGDQRNPALASDGNGNFVVAWQSYQDGSGYGVFGQRFDAAGVAQGGEFQINSFTVGTQWQSAVASGANGNFVVVWESSGQDGGGWGVFGQRFDGAGVPQGSEFPVNSYTTDDQRFPVVASDANGNFVVVWRSNGQDGSYHGVFGQRFNASGVPQGGEFRVNSYTAGDQRWPAVTSDASGNFVVVWQSDGQDGSAGGIFGQRFNASGVPQGAEFRVNSYTTSFQTFPAVSSDARGNFVVAWGSDGQDGGGYGVFGQRYGDLIFKDGFQ